MADVDFKWNPAGYNAVKDLAATKAVTQGGASRAASQLRARGYEAATVRERRLQKTGSTKHHQMVAEASSDCYEVEPTAGHCAKCTTRKVKRGSNPRPHKKCRCTIAASKRGGGK